MPFMVQELIKDSHNLVVAKLQEPVQHALIRMFEHDFSQLPIVDNENRPTGMITTESILRALSSFGVGLDKLQVEHARVKAEEFRSDADLFELLDKLQHTYAVLIVDGERQLQGIVTNYDTAEYFRRRAEDMMLVEDVETMIKDYIQTAYQVDEDQSGLEKLNQAVQRVANNGQALRRKFVNALSNYLILQSPDVKQGKPNSEWIETVFNRHFAHENSLRQFEDLSLADYINLLLEEKKWSQYQSVFNLERATVSTLLNKVRETRNALAHFRREITAEQRSHLRFSADWLAQYQDAISVAFSPKVLGTLLVNESINEESEVEVTPQMDEDKNILPIEDEAEPQESRYAPLAVWLQNQSPRKDTVTPTFAQITEIIGGELPRSAYEHRAWWANDSVGHVQAQQWLDVGWRVASVNLTTQVVRFARIQERQKAYIDFFSQLNAELKKRPGYDHIQPLPSGTNWSWTRNVGIDDSYLGAFNFSFGRGGIFRIELYIDSGDVEINKQLFDLLHDQKVVIEEKLGYELHWQRLNNRRASRIARILQASITDSKKDLALLQRDAIQTMVRLTDVLYPMVLELGRIALSKPNNAVKSPFDLRSISSKSQENSIT